MTRDISPSAVLDRIFLEAAVTCFDESEALLAYNLLETTESTHEKVLYMKCLFGQSAKELKTKPVNPFRPFNVPVMPQIAKTDTAKKEGKGHQQPNTNQSTTVGRGQKGQNVPSRPPPPPVSPNVPVNSAHHPVNPQTSPVTPPPPRPLGFNPSQAVVQPVAPVVQPTANRNQPPPPPPRTGPIPPPVVKKELEPVVQPVQSVYQSQTPPPPPPPVRQPAQ